MARILAIGGAHIDRTGRLFARHVLGASNPGKWLAEAGGGVFNAARNLARLGHDVALLAPRGGDAAGDAVAAAIEEAGIEDCSPVFLDRATASYTAILEPDGNLVTAMADMEIYDCLVPRRLSTSRFRARLARTDLVLIDANLRADTIIALSQMLLERHIPLAAIAISPAKVVRLMPVLGNLTLLFMNRREAGALTQNADDVPLMLRETGLAGGVISEGPSPVVAFATGQMISRAPLPRENVADVTGAGDALAAGFLHGWLDERPLAACLECGLTLADLTLSVSGPVDKNLSPEKLAASLRSLDNNPSQLPTPEPS